jgi:hypothetical protein
VLSTAFQSGLQVSLLLLRGHIGQAQTFLASKVHRSLDFASNYLRVSGAHIADALSDACHGLRCGDNNTAFAKVSPSTNAVRLVVHQEIQECSAKTLSILNSRQF